MARYGIGHWGSRWRAIFHWNSVNVLYDLWEELGRKRIHCHATLARFLRFVLAEPYLLNPYSMIPATKSYTLGL